MKDLHVFESKVPLSLSGKYKDKFMAVQFERPQNPYQKSTFVTNDEDEINFLKSYPTFKKDFVLVSVKVSVSAEKSKSEELRSFLEEDGQPSKEEVEDSDISAPLPDVTTPDAMKDESALSDGISKTEVANITNIQQAKEYLLNNYKEIYDNKALLSNKAKILAAAERVGVIFPDLQ